MKNAFWISYLIISGFTFNSIYAQYPVYDQEPSSQKWFQINAPHVQIIFAKGNDSLAIGLSNRLEAQYQGVSRSLNAYPKKLSLVLRSKTTIPNGFVTLAPRRSEFFTMPPQDYNFAGTNAWLDLLAVHEYRHVVQFEKANTGFNKLLSTVFGEEALAGMSFIAVPQWFWEGDAVVTETALTPSGRGRIPEFNLAFRANLLEKGPFSYNKQYLRSFKDFVPDHYVTGYFLVSHLRKTYDKNPWDEIVHKAFSKPYIPFTFSKAIRKETGKNVVGAYQNMVVEMDSVWQNQLDSLSITNLNYLTNPDRKLYTNYLYPQSLPNSDVVAFKEGLGDVLQLVRIKSDGSEKTEVITGLLANSGMLSAQNNLVSWVEYRPDARWGARTTNDIKVYDLSTRKLETVVKGSRYSAASLSPDGTKIASIYTTEENKFYLVILDIESGAEIQRFPNSKNYFLSMPRWSTEGRHIVALQLTENGKTIVQASVDSSTIRPLFAPSNHNYGHPVQTGNFVLYNLAQDGIDNIFAYDLKSGGHFQITSSRFGAFNPSFNTLKDTIVYNDYQVNGMDIAKIPFLPQHWTKLSKPPSEFRRGNLIEPISDQEEYIDDSTESLENYSEIEPYKPIKNIFNIHSWGVLLTESDNFLALGVKSRDVLSTTAFSAGYAHNPFENAGHVYGRISYQGFFPIIDVETRIGNRRIEETFRREDDIITKKISWNETHASLGLRIPLNLTRSRYFRSLQIGSKYEFTNVDNYNFDLRNIDQQANGDLHSLQYELEFSRLLRTSKRDIYSRWGQYLNVRYQHTPMKGDYSGELFQSQLILYNPAFFKHHSFFLKGIYQYQDIAANYRFGSNMIYPRGYNYVSLENMYVASANYSLPLLYPDLSLGPFFYFQRVKGNFFYDLGWGMYPGLKEPVAFESIGVELTVDFNFMRFLPLLNLGIRQIYLPNTASFETQLVIGSLGF